MTELLRHYLLYSFHSLTKYDYMAIGWILFLAILLMVLGAFIKRRSLSYSLLFFGLFLLFFGPPVIKMAMDLYLRAATVTIEKVKPLNFSRSLIVEGTIENSGRIDFSSCDIVLSVYRPNGLLKEWSAVLKPHRVDIEHFEMPLERGMAKPFKIIVDHFSNKDDFNVSVRARCYP